ncbi:MAG: hypothetical protein IKJ30_03300 [Bacilli bacterium]|nr:hypothetical protein [Bacilli bacterium]
MKKGFKLIFSALLALTLVGCSCDKGYNVKLTESKEVVSGSKLNETITTQDIYDYISQASTSPKNKAFILELVKIILKEKSGYKSGELTSTYNYKLKKYFEDNFINDNSYKVNGEFDEELLVATLRSQMAQIGDPITGATGVTYDLGLKYDYSKYIANNLDYDIYIELLKEDYISNNKSTILNKSKSRIITVYSAENLEDMEELVQDIFSGEYDSLEDLEETKRAEARKELGRQYCENLGLPNEYYLDENGDMIESCSPTKSSYDSALSKFTTCANSTMCSLKDGFDYQIKLANETEYLDKQLINKDTTEVLYENLLNQLLRDDIKDMLVGNQKMEDIFGNKYEELGNFVVTRTADLNSFDPKDIIHASGPDSTCYIVLVKVVDSSTENIDDKQMALEKLHSKVSDTSVLLHYVDDMNVELLEETLKEAYKGIFK